MNPRPFVTVRQLRKTYARGGREVSALRGIDLDIFEGEFVSIMGPSGSGKSTLLHIIGVLEKPTAGSCSIAGRDIAALDDDECSRLRRDTIGFVFQAFHLIPQLDVLENVAMPLGYAGVPNDTARSRALAALELVGLRARTRHRPNELSGGELQRAAIARALAGGPRLILADEPTGNLDSASGADILAILERLNASGTSLVLVTHDDRVASRASRRICMDDGLVVH